MFCKSCGAESSQGATFCERCGVPLPVAPPQPVVPVRPAAPVFCSRCGTENAGGSQFCKKCGASLAAGAAPVPPVAGTPAPVYYAPPMGASAPVPVAVPKPPALAGVLGPAGVKAALIGAVAGLVFILLAALVARPMIIGSWQPLMDASSSNNVPVRALVDGAVTVPFLAVNLHAPSESFTLAATAYGESKSFPIDVQSPISWWNGLPLLAIALAAFVTLSVAKPVSARTAVFLGVATSVVYAAGVLVLAAVASSAVDLTALFLAASGSSSSSAGAVSAKLITSFPFLGLAAYVLIAGAGIGAVVGLFYISYSYRRPFGDAVRESGLAFSGPVAAASVTLAIALVLSVVVAMGMWAYAKSKVPATPYLDTSTQQGLRIADGIFNTLTPSMAFYMYGFGHGVPYSMQASGAAVSSSSGPASMQVGIMGASAKTAIGADLPIPGGAKYEWWAYLMLLLPVVPLVVGGYLSAAWSRGAASLPLEGAKVAIPYAVAMLGLAWLTSMALKADVSSLGSGSGAVAFGSDMALTAVLALAWGGVFGALGGWVRQQRSLG